MPSYTSDYIYTPENWLKNHVLEVDESGQVIDLRPMSPNDQPIYHSGILCPGFINAHCHLELSSLHGLVPEGTGMAGFVKTLVQKRAQLSESQQLAALKKAMDAASTYGTVAIGDICNTPLTISSKQNHALYTHSFIEVLGLDAQKVDQIVRDGLALTEKYSPLPATLTPHAPYSMSAELIKGIYASNSNLLSIHLMESIEERTLFEKKNGPFADLYKQWGIPFKGFDSLSPIGHICHHLPKNQAVIFVHNTELTVEELDDLAMTFPHAYFCLCPRSNYYIHRTFPDIQRFLSYQDRICLGTDSLASNHSLDMFEEIKAIKKYIPSTDLHLLIQWLTTNGAKALHQGINFGIFAAGTRPGVNLVTSITHSNGQPDLSPETRVEKLH